MAFVCPAFSRLETEDVLRLSAPVPCWYRQLRTAVVARRSGDVRSRAVDVPRRSARNKIQAARGLRRQHDRSAGVVIVAAPIEAWDAGNFVSPRRMVTFSRGCPSASAATCCITAGMARALDRWLVGDVIVVRAVVHQCLPVDRIEPFYRDERLHAAVAPIEHGVEIPARVAQIGLEARGVLGQVAKTMPA